MIMMKISTVITVDNYSLFSRDFDGVGGGKLHYYDDYGESSLLSGDIDGEGGGK